MRIVKEIGMPTMLGQAAEECMELRKALLKLQRILMGTNPTPVTEEDARDDILEEATDVRCCLELLQGEGIDIWDPAQHKQKLNRWADRISKAKELRHDPDHQR